MSYIKWSFECLQEGYHPCFGPEGEPLPKGSVFEKLAGQPLTCQGHRAVIWSIQGDHEMYSNHLGLNHWNSQFCCWECDAQQPLTKGKPCPKGKAFNILREDQQKFSCITHAQALAKGSAHALFTIEGLSTKMVRHDGLHVMFCRGVRSHLCGSILHFLCYNDGKGKQAVKPSDRLACLDLLSNPAGVQKAEGTHKAHQPQALNGDRPTEATPILAKAWLQGSRVQTFHACILASPQSNAWYIEWNACQDGACLAEHGVFGRTFWWSWHVPWQKDICKGKKAGQRVFLQLCMAKWVGWGSWQVPVPHHCQIPHIWPSGQVFIWHQPQVHMEFSIRRLCWQKTVWFMVSRLPDCARKSMQSIMCYCNCNWKGLALTQWIWSQTPSLDKRKGLCPKTSFLAKRKLLDKRLYRFEPSSGITKCRCKKCCRPLVPTENIDFHIDFFFFFLSEILILKSIFYLIFLTSKSINYIDFSYKSISPKAYWLGSISDAQGSCTPMLITIMVWNTLDCILQVGWICLVTWKMQVAFSE